MDTVEIETVRAALAKTLNDPSVGRVLCAVKPSPGAVSDEERILSFLREACPEVPAPPPLFELPIPDAAFILCEMFRGWLFDVLPGKRAAELAGTCLAWFSPDVRCYSTYRIQRMPGGQYTAIGKAWIGKVHEMGVLFADCTRVGIVWICDED